MSDQASDEMAEFNSIAGSAGKRTSNPSSAKSMTDQAIASEDGKDRPLSSTAKMWAVYGKKIFSACEQAVDTVPPGQYTIKSSQSLGVYFELVDTNLDDLVKLPDSASEEVMKEIQTFWTKEEHFRRLGFMWKRGILIWGTPGGGKTSCLQMVSQAVTEIGGISVYVENPELAAAGLKIMRHIEPKRPIMVMLEDVDAIIDKHGEATLLALMDGELQIDNVVFVATTNYPERMDKRFINRPSRFDIVKKIGMPSDLSRELFLTTKNSRLKGEEQADELAQWVELTKDYSIAHMKELIVSVEVFGVPVEKAAKRLRTMIDAKPSSAEKERGLGFLN